MSENIGNVKYHEEDYEDTVLYLTNRRFVGEGETGGGLLSEATTSTAIEVELENIRNVSTKSGGMLSSPTLVLEFDEANYPKFECPVEDPESWKRNIEQAVSEVT